MGPCIDHGCKGFGIGYATTWITVDGKKYTTTKHRAVFFKHYGFIPEVVMHICDNARCINPVHLKAGTQLDNVRDMLTKGRQGDTRNFGMSNGNCSLSEDVVRYIRANYVKGSREFGCPALARKFKCGTSQIHRIVNGVHR